MSSPRLQPWPPRLAPLLVAVLVACATPSVSPSPSASAGPSVSSAPSTSAAPTGLAEQLRDAVDPSAILADVHELQRIADANGGVRAAGTEGHMASAGFVAEELRQAGYEVRLDTFNLPFFSQVDPGAVEILEDGAPTFVGIRDFKPMLFSASGDFSAPLFSLGFNPDARPGDRNGLGCNADDWAEVPAGVVVISQPGGCRRRQAVEHAQEAGVLALITAYPDWGPDQVLRPTLLSPDGIEIPVVGASHALGVALHEAAGRGAEVRLAIHTAIVDRTTVNVIAETPGGDASHVLMIGGHLDSVVDGPGINDNGSGTMAILEVARQLAALTGGDPTWKVRVAFWSGEELGLYGSFEYTNGLSRDERLAIAAYLNFDMLGSPNGVRLIYDSADATQREASGTIRELFEQALSDAGLAYELEALGGASDHYPFDQQRIPVGGLFSGANEIKSESDVALFGGTAGAAEDPCYHLPCDTADNVDAELLAELARSMAWVVGRLATGEVPLPVGE